MIKQAILFILVVGFVSITRLVPHLDNFSPMICLALFTTQLCTKRTSWVLIVLSVVISDVLVARHYGYAYFGYWTVFTYSGYAVITLLGTQMKWLLERFSLSTVTLLSSCLFFWVWTNFGVWLTSGMYAMTSAGLLHCYESALPFLTNSVMGAGMWFVLLFTAVRLIELCRSQKLSYRV